MEQQDAALLRENLRDGPIVGTEALVVFGQVTDGVVGGRTKTRKRYGEGWVLYLYRTTRNPKVTDLQSELGDTRMNNEGLGQMKW